LGQTPLTGETEIHGSVGRPGEAEASARVHRNKNHDQAESKVPEKQDGHAKEARECLIEKKSENPPVDSISLQPRVRLGEGGGRTECK